MKVPLKQLDTAMYSTQKPDWAEEILRELYAVKTLLLQQALKQEKRDGFYDFVYTFRKVMQAKPEEGSYPEVVINNMRVGITFTNLLYDKKDGQIIERTKAFEIYKSLYRAHQKKPLF